MPGSPKQVQFTRRFLEEKRKGKFGGKKKTYKCLPLRFLGPFFVFLCAERSFQCLLNFFLGFLYTVANEIKEARSLRSS